MRQTLRNLSKYLELEELDPLKNMIEADPFIIDIMKIAEKVEKSGRQLRAKKRQEALTKNESTK